MLNHLFRSKLDQQITLRPLFFYFNLIILPLIFYGVSKVKGKSLANTFAVANLIQQVLLYIWYIFFVPHLLLFQGLPVYHCRIAMIVISISLLIDWLKHDFIYYCSLLGVFGSIVSLLFLDMDIYEFPHFTNFSYLMGHYLLLFNSLFIIRNFQNRVPNKTVVYYTVFINTILQVINRVLDANYGQLNWPPMFINITIPQPFYFLLVNSIFIIVLVALNQLIYMVKFKGVYFKDIHSQPIN